jgi:hypothetical protein
VEKVVFPMDGFEQSITGRVMGDGTAPAGATENTDSNVRVVPLAGRQDISGLVHRGRVCLYDESGSIVELWGPEATEDNTIYRVKVCVKLSDAMKERYPDSFPQEGTTLTWQGDFVDVGSELYRRQGFEIDVWGGSRHWLVLPCVKDVQLVIGEHQPGTPWKAILA